MVAVRVPEGALILSEEGNWRLFPMCLPKETWLMPEHHTNESQASFCTSSSPYPRAYSSGATGTTEAIEQSSFHQTSITNGIHVQSPL